MPRIFSSSPACLACCFSAAPLPQSPISLPFKCSFHSPQFLPLLCPLSSPYHSLGAPQFVLYPRISRDTNNRMLFACCQSMAACLSAISSWIASSLPSSQIRFLFDIIKKVAIALLTCVFALGGATIGVISGALKGHTTETGFLRGFGVGAVAGAVTGVQLMELILNGEPFSKVALICSLVNGKIFMEWVSPAVLKAYQWQISTMDTVLNDIPDIFEVTTIRGLSEEAIKDLPSFTFSTSETSGSYSESGCVICLQDLNDGESARLLPSCQHFFHVHCIDEWLTLQGNCPICREDV